MKCISCAEEQRHNLLEVGCNEIGLKHHCEDLANEVIDDMTYAESNVPPKFPVTTTYNFASNNPIFKAKLRYVTVTKIQYAIATISGGGAILNGQVAGYKGSKSQIAHMTLWACTPLHMHKLSWGPVAHAQMCDKTKPMSHVFSYHIGGTTEAHFLPGTGINVGYQTAFPYLLLSTSYEKYGHSDSSGFDIETQAMPVVNLVNMLSVTPAEEFVLKSSERDGAVAMYHHTSEEPIFIQAIVSRMHAVQGKAGSWNMRTIKSHILRHGLEVDCKLLDPYSKCKSRNPDSITKLQSYTFPTKTEIPVVEHYKKFAHAPVILNKGDVIRVQCLYKKGVDEDVVPDENADETSVCELSVIYYEMCPGENGMCSLLKGSGCTPTKC